ncbi:hypothetical protein LJC04_04150, partial [Ruminococcaceae bacterium OttesenSCG-928-O06]|nr:hypothetical protein [Ruminococcaceae bacterium OttesenSCG-928-O06]
LGMYTLLCGFFSLLQVVGITDFTLPAMVLNIVAMDAAVVMLYFCGRRLFGVKKALFLLVACVFTLPFTLYVPILYTHTLMMPFVVGVALLWIGARSHWRRGESGKVFRNFCILSALAAVGALIKLTVLIIWIAVALDLLILLCGKGRLRVLLAGLAVLAAVYVGGSFGMRALPMAPAISREDGIPPQAWVLLGLENEGGFSEGDFAAILEHEGREERTAYVNRELKNRLEALGPVGIALHLGEKIGYTYGDGTLGAPAQLAKTPVQAGMAQSYFLPTANGYVLVGYASFALLAATLFWMAVAGAKALYRKNDALTFGRIALFGLALFLLVWKTAPAELVGFMPLFLLCAVEAAPVPLLALQKQRAREDAQSMALFDVQDFAPVPLPEEEAPAPPPAEEPLILDDQPLQTLFPAQQDEEDLPLLDSQDTPLAPIANPNWLQQEELGDVPGQQVWPTPQPQEGIWPAGQAPEGVPEDATPYAGDATAPLLAMLEEAAAPQAQPILPEEAPPAVPFFPQEGEGVLDASLSEPLQPLAEVPLQTTQIPEDTTVPDTAVPPQGVPPSGAEEWAQPGWQAVAAAGEEPPAIAQENAAPQAQPVEWRAIELSIPAAAPEPEETAPVLPEVEATQPWRQAAPAPFAQPVPTLPTEETSVVLSAPQYPAAPVEASPWQASTPPAPAVLPVEEPAAAPVPHTVFEAQIQPQDLLQTIARQEAEMKAAPYGGPSADDPLTASSQPLEEYPQARLYTPAGEAAQAHAPVDATVQYPVYEEYLPPLQPPVEEYAQAELYAPTEEGQQVYPPADAATQYPTYDDTPAFSQPPAEEYPQAQAYAPAGEAQAYAPPQSAAKTEVVGVPLSPPPPPQSVYTARPQQQDIIFVDQDAEGELNTIQGEQPGEVIWHVEDGEWEQPVDIAVWPAVPGTWQPLDLPPEE